MRLLMCFLLGSLLLIVDGQSTGPQSCADPVPFVYSMNPLDTLTENDALRRQDSSLEIKTWRFPFAPRLGVARVDTTVQEHPLIVARQQWAKEQLELHLMAAYQPCAAHTPIEVFGLGKDPYTSCYDSMAYMIDVNAYLPLLHAYQDRTLMQTIRQDHTIHVLRFRPIPERPFEWREYDALFEQMSHLESSEWIATEQAWLKKRGNYWVDLVIDGDTLVQPYGEWGLSIRA